jgi:L-ascorbate metabolism protein UlaG (beta-lactamase superfamily)|tara:strand:- start:1318 stop:2364 length:1047 start_codon:yes stop_codon:yes gene_type:complete
LRYFRQFGGKVSTALKDTYSRSPQWKKKKFYNFERTGVDIRPWNVPKLIYRQIFDRKGRIPTKPLPVVVFDKEAFLAPSDKAKMIWFGHSVVLLRVDNKTILIDPMFGPNAAPVAPFSVARFSENTLAIIDELPEIDLMLLTHDHYDHLDLASMEKLMPKINNYYVALGAARHLVKWGVSNDQISEFDWWEDRLFEGIKITYTPTRHASGRAIQDQSCCLWGGWSIQSSNEKIWFSGDGGYGDHFKEIGERLGPFDFAFMECGQYNVLWHDIHLYPEESVQAAKDVDVRTIMPVHWAGFALAMHHWKEPVERFSAEAKKQSQAFIIPEIGELFNLNSKSNKNWWKELS